MLIGVHTREMISPEKKWRRAGQSNPGRVWGDTTKTYIGPPDLNGKGKKEWSAG